MLLVEKSTSKIVRQEKEEVLQTLGLPLAALARYSHDQRLDVRNQAFGPDLLPITN